MSKSVLISIQPYWVFLIIAKTMGWDIYKEKAVEVRKNYPKDRNWNKVAKIYCSKSKKSFAKIPKEYQSLMEKFLGKVIGEFMCDEIEDFSKFPYELDALYRHIKLNACITDYSFISQYLKDTKCGYGWHISNLKIYDKPKELKEFVKSNTLSYDEWLYGVYDGRGYAHWNYEHYLDGFRINRPPQSWCYIEELR